MISPVMCKMNIDLYYTRIVPFKLDMDDPFQLNLLFFLSMYRPPMEGKLNDATFAFARQQYLNLHCTVHFWKAAYNFHFYVNISEFTELSHFLIFANQCSWTCKQVAISQINNRGSLLLSGYQTFTRCPCLCPDLRWKTSDHNIHSKKTWPPFFHQNWVISLLREERGGIAGVRVGHFSWGQMEMVTWISYKSSIYSFSFPRR